MFIEKTKSASLTPTYLLFWAVCLIATKLYSLE